MSHKFAQSTSLLQTTDLIFLGDLEKVDENKEVVEKNAEFSEHLNGMKQISSLLLV